MCKGREGIKCPAGCPISAGKPERYRNTGGVLVCEIGHPIVVCQAAVACEHSTQSMGCPERLHNLSVSHDRPHAELTTLLAF